MEQINNALKFLMPFMIFMMLFYILSKKYLVGLCILGLILLGRNSIKK
ncbi:putative membrane protein [[Clostridium] sordellii VPI 9048]|nr:hypothetical protein [Paeniclostridium sordellii]EPZ61736.1 putative membrane protein [[Clostridium] sordellii VPI 9048] [Paeniclostridium sordellii VPI 9048]CEK36632.1 hypothetical protein UMC2PCS14_00561 (plasmid) [[Clostridium] sordellii] [Paeniclostridium sordellii]